MDGADGRAFGKLLRQLRLGTHLSQEALAERAEMSVKTISALERGARRSPYRGTVSLLADALHLSDDDRTRLEAASARRPLPIPSLRVVPNSLASRDAGGVPPNNLPAELSSLIGRTEVVAAVCALLDTHRLVTLVGSGGIGKTRVALRVAENMLRTTPDGVWLVELAAVGQAALVQGAVARVLGVKESPQRSLLESVVAALRRERVLLVLDNGEHVIAELRNLVLAILRGCPGAKILVTSRESLNAPGEWTYRVPSLAHPPHGELTTAQVAGFASVTLFGDRAQAVDRAFSLSDSNATAVAEICRRLDGVPLAIELAAAWANTLAPGRLAQMLDDRFRVLTGGDRSALPRLKTMRAAIDWSFELLGEPERVLSGRLAVFAGGWTLEAAESVCSCAPLKEAQICDLLASLVDRSIVTVSFSEGEARYGYLESLRAYGLEQLIASGEREVVVRRHAEWAADYGEWLSERVFYAQTEEEGSVALEAFNRREALDWALGEAGDAVLAGRIAGCMPFVLNNGADWAVSDADASRSIEMALSRMNDSPERSIEARLWLALGTATGGERSLIAGRKAVALFDQLDERTHWFGHALRLLERAYKYTGRFAEALAVSDRRFVLLHGLAAADSWFHRSALSLRAQVLKELGRYDESRRCLIEVSALCDSSGERHATMVILAELEFHAGNVREAAELADESASAYPLSEDAGGTMWELPTNRCNAAAYRLVLGEIDEAQRAALSGLELVVHRRLTHTSRQQTWAIAHLATVAALRGDTDRAVRLMGYVDAWYLAEGEAREYTEQRAYDILVGALQQRLNAADIERLAAEGALLNRDTAVDMALAIGRTPTAPD